MLTESASLFLQAENAGPFSQFFEKQFYGNTVGEWTICLLIVFGSVVVGKILYWMTQKFLKTITAKTKTQVDDIIIDMVEEPLVFSMVIVGIYIGLSTLTLPDTADNWALKLVYVLIAINIAWLVTRFFDAIFKHFIEPLAQKSENDLDDQLLPILKRGTRTIIWTLAVIVGMNNAGYDVGALLAGLGIGGLALAMAAQDTVSNVFGGFTIFSDRPFKLKDRIKIQGYDGTVEEIGLRSTRIRTLEGRVVTIPNSSFTDNPVENVTWEPTRKVVLNLGLTYDTPPTGMEKGIQVLRAIAKDNDGVERASCGFNAFGDFALGIVFIYYIKKGEDILGRQTEVNLEIMRRFASENLDMAFPTQTIYNISQAG